MKVSEAVMHIVQVANPDRPIQAAAEIMVDTDVGEALQGLSQPGGKHSQTP